MMAASVDTIGEHCFVSEAEEELLSAERRPIVLLERKPDSIIPRAVAPGVNRLGFMLPYSPHHYLLFEDLDRPLVMTSGNISDEPICYEDEDALERLAPIADYFLLHNRRIHIRTDDSVARAVRGARDDTAPLARLRARACQDLVQIRETRYWPAARS